MTPTLSVLIVNWKSTAYLRRCLQTIRSTCGDLALQIVVVDGGSFDGCGEMLAAEFPDVEFVQSRENIGFGRSNNLGFERVAGDVLLLLNPDTELKPDAVRILLQELQSHPDAGILGPKLLNSDGSLQTSCVQSLPTPWNQALDSEFLRRIFPGSRMWGVAEAFRASGPVAVEAVSGACMMLRSDVFRQVHGFSSEFFMYGEDMDLCAKVRRLGMAVYHVPGAEVFHHGSGSARTQDSQFNSVMTRVAVETYMRLNHGAATAHAYRALQGVSSLVRMALLLFAVVLLPGERRSAAAASLRKWYGVLKWVLGINPMRGT